MKRRLFVPLAAAVVAVPLGFTAPRVLAHGTSAAMSYHVMLTGKAEVPVKGPKSGSGTATVTLNLARGTVCYSITVRGIDLPAIVDHVHAGKAGKMGNVLVGFPTAPGKNGRAVGCAKGVKANTIKAIEAHPTSYYLNVHTKKYPGGAVRGQL